ncbi:hypothetical protein HHL19_23275 [Streptomyces sp. R302]|uniref:hypothetical protein n=1 Tax=unclassified Streptomyces TaxID=2593676 RepID=UPI00145E3FD1|nr:MULTISPECIES: hypothetical protein [unclassified Streptomyces]NML51869.1 hypothetical protein [Streptomyces sp. R301]NML81489.1 hypothetical protein [Streptomyces sp. R302]
MSTARTTPTGPVRHERRGPAADVTMARPASRDARNSATTCAPERDAHLPFERRAGLWRDHSDKEGTESRFPRESTAHPGMCRRRREPPWAIGASARGDCVAGGLTLAWIVDLIGASEDAFLADPVVRIGIPGVGYFAHRWVMPPRTGLADAHDAETARDALGGMDIHAKLRHSGGRPRRPREAGA